MRSLKRTSVAVVLAWVSLADAAWGEALISLQITPVVADVRSDSVLPIIRSDAPVPVEIALNSATEDLVEGQLELTLLDGRTTKVLGRVNSGDVAFTAGGQQFQMLLPPVQITGELPLLQVAAAFRAGETVTDLGSYEIRVPFAWRRAFVIEVCEPWDSGIAYSAVEPLRLDQFQSHPELRGQLTSVPVRLVAGDAPRSPLGYFSYDVMYLTAEGFPEMKAPQLEALAEWIEAGGSACVVANAVLEPHHVQFLNRIAGGAAGEGAFLADEAGRLIDDPIPEDRKLGLYRPGLGRAVISREPIDAEDPANLEQMQAVAFLWKVRNNQIDPILSQGKWQLEKPGVDPAWELELIHPYRHVPLRRPEIASLLMPDQVRGIPLGVVVVILVLFLLAIAPGDYYLLGYFNRRKYTWILFIALSLGFTWFTARLAQAYLGGNDYRRALVLVDVFGQGKVARTSRLEMLFTATQKEVRTEYRNCVLTKIDPGRTPPSRVGGPAARPKGEAPPENLPVFEGRMPAFVTLHQQMRQWSPQLVRQTRLESDAAAFEFDWDSVDADAFGDVKGSRALAAAIQSADPAASAFLLHGNEFHRLAPVDAEPLEGQPPERESRYTKRSDDELLVQLLSARPSENLFQIVSQVAPTGSDNLEDLSILDPTDPAEWMLAIVVERGEDRVVYRRLYRSSR